MAEGTVRWFDDVRGYGFIVPDYGGRDVRFERGDIQKLNHKSVEARERVSFDFEFRAGGEARAVRITPLGERVPLPTASRPAATGASRAPGRSEWIGCWLTLLLLACVVAGVVLLVRTSW